MPTYDDRNEGAYIRRYVYDGSGNVIYAGWAAPGTVSSAAGWAIRRYSYTGTNMTLSELAGGNNLMTSIWDNYASLAYS
jgi:hypothetical protein